MAGTSEDVSVKMNKNVLQLKWFGHDDEWMNEKRMAVHRETLVYHRDHSTNDTGERWHEDMYEVDDSERGKRAFGVPFPLATPPKIRRVVKKSNFSESYNILQNSMFNNTI